MIIVLRVYSLHSLWRFVAKNIFNIMSRLKEESERVPWLNGTEEKNDDMVRSNRRILLHVMFVCWGIGTWLGVNGIFIQLPLLVEQLPEGWTLPSYMTAAVQVANIGLLIYAGVRKCIPRITDAMCIYGLLAVLTVALILNAFLYSETVSIGGSERSIAFIILTFFSALVGCTSTVLFYPYLRHFRELYLATFLVGEGLSGFIPSVLALIQGIGGEPECILSPDNSTMLAVYPKPLFNSTVFMIMLGLLSALSLTCFSIIHNNGGFSSERLKKSETEDKMAIKHVSLLQKKWLGVMLLTLCLNALFNGVMPSVKSFSCRPYGKKAYHLAVTLGAMANPVACLAGVWMRLVSGRVLAVMLSVASMLVVYILFTAIRSPTPPLHDETIGAVLIVLCWVLAIGLISYARMWIYEWARQGGARGMRVCGVVIQGGSAVGCLLMFLLVNYGKVFQQADVCPATI